MISYDKLAVNHQMLLDLPFYEGIGAVTRDQSKPHHQDIDLVNTPTWTSIASDLGVLELDGATEYLELANADCLDLDFLTTDYSLAGWINWEHAAHDDHNIIGRYEVDVSGWEVYLFDDPNYYLTVRHHHAGTCPAGPPDCRTGCYSSGWTQGTWHFFGISRSGASLIHYRNGIALPTTCSVGGLTDPETCAQDLVIGARFSKDDNWFKGMMQGLRVWGRSLSASEWLQIFNRESHWYGV